RSVHRDPLDHRAGIHRALSVLTDCSSSSSAAALGPACALRRQPDRGVGGPVAVVTAAPLDHLEEHLAHRRGVEVHELSAGLAVVAETELMQLADGFGGEVES